jgi:drug/metabolite transporter (DMT)-like permease
LHVHGELLLGLGAAFGAATCFDGAVVLQAADARGVPSAQGLRLALLQTLVRRPRWVLGTIIAILGWPLQLLAFAFIPVTVVQPALAVGMLVLLAGGSRLLGERVGPREWAAAVAIIVGVALLAIGHPDVRRQVPITPGVIACLAVLGAVAVSPLAARPRPRFAWLVAAAGSAFALSALTGKLLVSELDAGHLVPAVAFAAATAAAAGVGFLVDMSALQRYDATRAAPPMFVLETAIPVMLAPWLFDERWGSSVGGGSLIVLGLLLVLAGGGALGASRAVSGLEDEVGSRAA